MEDELGDIILGDRVTNTTIPTPHQPAKTPWGQVALAAGLMASGVGLPAGAAILANALTTQTKPAVTTQAPTPNASRELLSIDMVVEPPATK